MTDASSSLTTANTSPGVGLTASKPNASAAAAGGRARLFAEPTTIHVEAPLLPASPTSRQFSAEAVESAAGAFEDPSRYVQLLPGVISDNDQRNDFLVRGGNPGENLFVIDNIDVHSINHLALSDTTGGFASMIDNAAIQSMTLHTAAHDAKFDDRLSSVVEISTVPEHVGPFRPHRMAEAGISGVGGMFARPLGPAGSLLISGRQSVSHLVTNDIGMNGVPKYRNMLVRADQTLGNGDKVWGLSLTGIDSILIHPSPTDSAETNPFDIGYSGWRSTTGINYQHLFSARSIGVLTLYNSDQAQSVKLNAQMLHNLGIYDERTHDRDSALKAQFTTEVRSWLTLSGGIAEDIKYLNYSVVQPDGIPNPYTAASYVHSATAMHENIHTPDHAGYAQFNLILPANFRVTAATRIHHWSYGDHTALTPKASLSVPLGPVASARTLTLGYADYAQLPPFLYLLAFPQSNSLSPIVAHHLTASIAIIEKQRLQASISAYRKLYEDYPVSLQFPQLSMANIADTFGQAFLMFPMSSQGRGRAAGIELSVDAHPTSRLTLSGNLTYSRSFFSGSDGVMRRGNFDLPLVGNIAAVIHGGHGLITSIRYSGTSGRPYTPDDLAMSYREDRDVYDLNRVNGVRSATYSRFDFRIERPWHVGGGTLISHLGLDNALDHKNFYMYQWQTLNKKGPAAQYQMPIFPDGGVKYSF